MLLWWIIISNKTCCFHLYFVIICKNASWDFDRDCTESVHQYREHCHLKNINSSKPRTWDVFPLMQVSFNFIEYCLVLNLIWIWNQTTTKPRTWDVFPLMKVSFNFFEYCLDLNLIWIWNQTATRNMSQANEIQGLCLTHTSHNEQSNICWVP